MKKFIAIQLAMFFITASFLYLYASSVFGASTVQYKSIMFMTPTEATKIWEAVDALEDLWLTPGLTFTKAKEEKRREIVINLIALVRPYEDLVSVVQQLLKAYNDHKIEQFSAYKAKIAEMLAPVWQEAILEEIEKKAKKNQGWFARIKANITQSLNKLYEYLFPAKKEIKRVSQPTSKSAASVKT